MAFIQVGTIGELEDAFARSETEPILLYKHSATCVISAVVRRSVSMLDESTDPAVYEIVVQQARPLSNRVAEQTGVRHETPQVILLWQRKAVWNASHHRISADRVRNHVAELRSKVL